MRLRPLEQFICDECGELIEKLEDGWLEWIDDCKNPIHSPYRSNPLCHALMRFVWPGKF